MTTRTSPAETDDRPRILVTGGSGFIAWQTLAPLLAPGFDVHAVGRSPQSDTPGVTWHRGGLRGKQVAMLGLSFKAGTDDLHDSPALALGSPSRRRAPGFTPTIPSLPALSPCRALMRC